MNGFALRVQATDWAGVSSAGRDACDLKKNFEWRTIQPLAAGRRLKQNDYP